MPRPRQRRGADAKKDEKKAKREKEEQEALAAEAAAKRFRNTKSQMPILPTASSSTLTNEEGGFIYEQALDPDALPEPDVDTKAYFREIADKISELEALGQGRGSYGKATAGVEGEDDDIEEDDRPLLLRSALESLSGHEIPLAGDGDTSIILERLLYAMDDFARRVLADRFMGNYVILSKHRAASHVVQTLFTLAGETVDRETRGIIAPPPPGTTSSVALPTMTSLLLSALTELLPTLSTQIYDSFSSHTLRILLLIFSGKTPSTDGGRLSAERSRKSALWRKGQGTMKSFLNDGGEAGKISDVKRKVPKEFDDALVSMWESLNSLDVGGNKGDGVRRAAMDEVAGPAIRIMIEMEAEPKNGGWQTGGWADRVLIGLVEEVQEETTNEDKSIPSQTSERTEKRDEYLGGLLRHPAGSPTLEMLLLKSNDLTFKKIWDGQFRGKLTRLSGNSVANFVVAVGISRLDAEMFEETVKEVLKIGTERRGEWVDNTRTGVFKSLLDRAAQLKVCEKEVCEIMLDTFQLNDVADQSLVIPCVLSLNRLTYYKKLPAHLTAVASTQGSVLLQSWLKLSSPHQKVVTDCLFSLDFNSLLPYTRDPTSSHIIDSFLSSPTTPPSSLRKFLISLLGSYHLLADDRIGSRVAEKCWTTADVYLKDKIAASLVDQIEFLQKSQFGHYFGRKVEIPLWIRKREDWKIKMGNGGFSVGGGSNGRKPLGVSSRDTVGPAVVVVEGKKRRERVEDEMDDIFAGKVKRGKTEKSVVVVEPVQVVATPMEVDGTEEEDEAAKAKREKKDQKKKLKKAGLDDIFNALKASTE